MNTTFSPAVMSYLIDSDLKPHSGLRTVINTLDDATTLGSSSVTGPLTGGELDQEVGPSMVVRKTTICELYAFMATTADAVRSLTSVTRASASSVFRAMEAIVLGISVEYLVRNRTQVRRA